MAYIQRLSGHPKHGQTVVPFHPTAVYVRCSFTPSRTRCSPQACSQTVFLSVLCNNHSLRPRLPASSLEHGSVAHTFHEPHFISSNDDTHRNMDARRLCCNCHANLQNDGVRDIPFELGDYPQSKPYHKRCLDRRPWEPVC